LFHVSSIYEAHEIKAWIEKREYWPVGHEELMVAGRVSVDLLKM
jgi:hypothetical protein